MIEHLKHKRAHVRALMLYKHGKLITKTKNVLSHDVASGSDITPYHIFKTHFAVITQSLHMR